MKKNQVWKYLSSVGPYAGAGAICLAILVWVMKLWQADLTIPLGYSGDGLFTSVSIKGTIDNGWYLQNPLLGMPNPLLGMPSGMDLRDYPGADNLYFLIIKLLTLFTNNYAVILNLFFLISFPLTTLTALYTFRQFKLSFPAAILGSLLFTFLPYHFLRGIGHLFLSSYYVVPLAGLMILWLYAEPIFSRRKMLCSMLICLLVSSTGVYYAFFTCFFLVVAGLSALLRQRKYQPLLLSGVFVAVIFLGFIVNIFPSLAYAHTYGANSEVAQRSPAESEIYALKITQLLLPVSGHRLAYFEHAKSMYNNSSFMINENDTASLGICGSIGFLVLLGCLFFRKPALNRPKLFRNLSELNIAAVLLATMGGLGALFNYLISPQIRGYNRISVFIAFFSIFAFIALLDELRPKMHRFTTFPYLYSGILGLILFIGIWDQTTANYVPDYAALKAEYVNDGDFIRELEASVPKNAMIFQLPYVPFPENPPVNKMSDYDFFRGYLHSQNLRWSYGAMKGRQADLWQREIAAKPVEELVQALALANFSGLYLDRFGYADQGKEIEQKLSQLLNIQPITSENNRLVYFNLRSIKANIKVQGVCN